MPVAPGRRPIATGKDAVMIAGHQCAPRRRRNRAARVADFPLELAEPGDPRDGGVTGEPANRLGRHRAAPLELTGGRALDPGQRVRGGRDDQLRSRPRAVRTADLGSLAAATAAADLHQGVGQSLSGTPIVALRGPGIGLNRGPDDGAGVWRDLALDPDQSVDRLANLQVAPPVRPVRVVPRALYIHSVLEVPSDARKLTVVHVPGGLEQSGLGLVH